MEKTKKNLEESIYSRLKNVAKQRKRPVQEVLKYYAMERFLYRLSMSSHQNTFYGIWLLIQQFDFDHKELQGIIHQVLKNRGTSPEVSPIAFLDTFYNNPIKKDKWNAFLRDISHEPVSLEKVAGDLSKFFANVLT